MARDTAAAAGKNSTTAQGLAGTYGDRASSTYNILTPTLNRMATNPQGFSPQTKANMLTSAKQSIGGSNSGIVGGSDLAAARTNNAGAFAPMATQAAHDATSALSDASLGVQNRDAMLQEQQRQEGLSGLQGMYGENVGAGESALGLSDQALQTQLAAGRQGWLQNTLGVIGTLNGSANAASGLKQAFG